MAVSEGIDIFVNGIPKTIQEKRVQDYLHPHLQRHGITRYELCKGKNKGFALLYIQDSASGQAFLNAMKNQTNLRFSHKFPLRFSRNATARDMKDERFVEEKMAQIEASEICEIQKPKITYLVVLNTYSTSKNYPGHSYLSETVSLCNNDSIVWRMGIPSVATCFRSILHSSRSWKASHG
jgi:hypothetical protein